MQKRGEIYNQEATKQRGGKVQSSEVKEKIKTNRRSYLVLLGVSSGAIAKYDWKVSINLLMKWRSGRAWSSEVKEKT